MKKIIILNLLVLCGLISFGQVQKLGETQKKTETISKQQYLKAVKEKEEKQKQEAAEAKKLALINAENKKRSNK
ncbi:hypothetical protein ACFOWM_11760 [Ferruginibacter yonginensis]|uniref:Uncharacterized protein n=1 Tax=Ferruginibacter yonginensis TaxID=1310416 RepID=A0ABV8QUM2_9BACT